MATRNSSWVCLIVALTEHKGDPCPDGWVHENGTIEAPRTPHPLHGCLILNLIQMRGIMLDKFPLKVKELQARIEFYNATHVKQLDPPLDPRSDP